MAEVLKHSVTLSFGLACLCLDRCLFLVHVHVDNAGSTQSNVNELDYDDDNVHGIEHLADLDSRDSLLEGWGSCWGSRLNVSVPKLNQVLNVKIEVDSDVEESVHVGMVEEVSDSNFDARADLIAAGPSQFKSVLFEPRRDEEYQEKDACLLHQVVPVYHLGVPFERRGATHYNSGEYHDACPHDVGHVHQHRVGLWSPLFSTAADGTQQ